MIRSINAIHVIIAAKYWPRTNNIGTRCKFYCRSAIYFVRYWLLNDLITITF